MRLNSPVLLLLAAALLLAESQPGLPGQRLPGQPVEVRTSNASVDIIGVDIDRVQLDGDSQFTVKDTDGRVVVEGALGTVSLRVPRRSTIDVMTSNGSIHVAGVAGKMRLNTSNGLIIVQDAAEAEIHAHSSNGLIELKVPGGLNANLSARTSNGQIYSDVEIATTHIGANILEGKIGDGGPEIDLQTSNGSIRLEHESRGERVSSKFTPDQVK